MCAAWPVIHIAPNGKRVLALMPVDTAETQEAQNHVVFLVDFLDELRPSIVAECLPGAPATRQSSAIGPSGLGAEARVAITRRCFLRYNHWNLYATSSRSPPGAV